MDDKKIEKLKQQIDDEELFLEGWRNIIKRSQRLHDTFGDIVEKSKEDNYKEVIEQNGHNEVTVNITMTFNDLWNINQLLFDGIINQWHVRDEHSDKLSKLRNKLQKELNK